jgi:hypothetical protein
MNTPTTTVRQLRPYAVPTALAALEDAIALMRRAKSLAFLHNDMALNDALHAHINRSTQALHQARKP